MTDKHEPPCLPSISERFPPPHPQAAMHRDALDLLTVFVTLDDERRRLVIQMAENATKG